MTERNRLANGAERHRAASLVASVLVLLLALSGLSCSNSKDSASTTTAPSKPTEDECKLITPANRQKVLGQKYDVVNGSRSASACSLRGADGVSLLSIVVHTTETPQTFDALVDSTAAVKVSGLGDDARFWMEQEPAVALLVVRTAGSAATLRLSGPFPFEPPRATTTTSDAESSTNVTVAPGKTATTLPDPVAPTASQVSADMKGRLLKLGRLILPQLPRTKYVAKPASGSVVPGCDEIEQKELDKALSVPAGAMSTLTSSGEGCTYSTGTGVVLMVTVLRGKGDAKVLGGYGREVTVDGKSVEWPTQKVDGVGSGAVWLSDPVSGSSGELYALFETSIVQVMSSGAGSSTNALANAVAFINVVAPALVAK